MNGENDHVHLHEDEKTDLALHATLCYERYCDMARELRFIRWSIWVLVIVLAGVNFPELLKLLALI